MDLSFITIPKDSVEIEHVTQRSGEVLAESMFAIKDPDSVLWELIKQYLEKRGLQNYRRYKDIGKIRRRAHL